MAIEPDEPKDEIDGIDSVDIRRIKGLITQLHKELASLDVPAMAAFARRIDKDKIENLATFLSEILVINRRNQ